jgi:hypothetical protein
MTKLFGFTIELSRRPNSVKVCLPTATCGNLFDFDKRLFRYRGVNDNFQPKSHDGKIRVRRVELC